MGVASEFERCCQVTGVYDHTRRQCVFGARITRYMFVFFFFSASWLADLERGSRALFTASVHIDSSFCGYLRFLATFCEAQSVEKLSILSMLPPL